MATRLKSSSVRAVLDNIPLAACLRRRLQFDDVHIERQRKLSFWSEVNGAENVVVQATYDSVRTKEFTLVTYHYDVVIGQYAPNDTKNSITNSLINTVSLGSRVVSVLDSGAEGPGFKSQSRRCRVTVLGKLFTPIVPLFTKQWYW